MAPRSVPAVKHLVRSIRASAATDAARAAVQAGTAVAVEALLRERLLAELKQHGDAADGLLALVDNHILPDSRDIH